MLFVERGKGGGPTIETQNFNKLILNFFKKCNLYMFTH